MKYQKVKPPKSAMRFSECNFMMLLLKLLKFQRKTQVSFFEILTDAEAKK